MSQSDSNRVLVLLALLVIAATLGLTLLIARSGPAGESAQGTGRSTEGDPSLEPLAPVRLGGDDTKRPGSRSGTPPRPSPPLPDYRVEGATRWQRRLSAGEALQDLERRARPAAADLEGVAAKIAALAPHLLPYHDTMVPPTGTDRSMVRDVLHRLTVPRRDRPSFALHMVDEIEDELGRGALLRIWTRRPRFSRETAEQGQALLERLLGVAGGTEPDGFDVVVTGARGRDVFPRSPMETRAIAGYYAPQDDLVVLGLSASEPWMAHVLKHELVHAWQHRHVGPWTSRFLGEGLAEYLAWIEPTDRSFEVPVERLKHDFRALLTLVWSMERLGVRFEEDLRPRQLARLSPGAFYALGHLGYLVAEATLAYLEVGRRMGNLSEGELLKATEGVRWSTLMAFVHKHAEGGVAGEAFVVQDRSGLEGSTVGWSARSVLRALGVKLPSRWSDAYLAGLLRLARPVPRNDETRVRHVARALEQTTAAPRVFVDGSTALGDDFRLAETSLPDGWDLGDAAPSTRVAFVTAWVKALGERPGDDVSPPITVLRVGRYPSPTWPITPQGSEATASGIADVLDRDGLAIVVLVASPDALRGAIADALNRSSSGSEVYRDDERVGDYLTQALAAELAGGAHRPAAVLVVDLADGQSDAARIAQAFQLHLPDGQVALWDPQQPLR